MKIKPVKLSDEDRGFLLTAIDAFASDLPDSVESVILRKTITKKLQARRRNPLFAERARNVFLDTEEQCKQTNKRIRASHGDRGHYADPPTLLLASRKIAQILGTFSVAEMLDLGRFGPGSTFRCRGVDVSRARKFSLCDVTPEFEKQARGLLAEYPLWAEYLSDGNNCCPILDVVPGGRFSTVPKDSEIDRSIIVEPTINSWFQQGIGRMIRRRLKRSCGVDLDDQSLNRRLAHLGSLSDDLATVDLKSASDLISKELVFDLLPQDWAYWLDITRSQRVCLNGEWLELEKFSSMGNGFTFDLESLIFYALSWATTVQEGYNPFWVNVFGDDIVIPAGVKDPFLKLFDAIGFKVNVEKSFFQGPFRESCGHDYYRGRNVRGVYCKRLETSLDVMKIHNRFYEWSMRTGIDTEQLRAVFRMYSPESQYTVPCSLGDLGFHGRPPRNIRSAPDGMEGFRIRVLLPILKKVDRFDRFLLLEKLQGSDFQRNSIPLRTDPIGFRVGEVVSRWDT